MTDKLPWFPFFPTDFLTDEKVLAMSYQEIGMYMVLLCHQWVNGSIPADASQAQARLKLGSSQLGDDREAASLAHVMAECFVPLEGQPGRLVNLKLFRVRAEQEEKSQRLSDAGRRGGKAKPGLSQAQARLKPGSSIEERESEAELLSSSTGRDTGDLSYAQQCAVAANEGLRVNAHVTLPGPITPILASDDGQPNEWEAAGIPLPVVLAAIRAAALRYRPTDRRRQPRSLRYFDGAVRDAFAESQQPQKPAAPSAPARSPAVKATTIRRLA